MNGLLRLNFPFSLSTEPSLLVAQSSGSPLPWLQMPFPCQAGCLPCLLFHRGGFSLSQPRAFLSLLWAESWSLSPGELQAEQPRSQCWVTVTWLLAGRGGERGGGGGENNCAIFPFFFFFPSSFFFPCLSQVTHGSVVKGEKAEGAGFPSSGLEDTPSGEGRCLTSLHLWVQ